MLNKIIIPLYMSLEIWCHCVSSSKKKTRSCPGIDPEGWGRCPGWGWVLSYLNTRPKRLAPGGKPHASWLVVYLPFWKIWKSVGIILLNLWQNKTFSNHQPASFVTCWKAFWKDTRDNNCFFCMNECVYSKIRLQTCMMNHYDWVYLIGRHRCQVYPSNP